MKQFLVYKSSAGSGKTFTLVREYLLIALATKQPERYKSILAITFTNKAASEMKDRVVGYLKAFIKNDELSGGDLMMFNFLKNALKIKEEELLERSEKMLASILHNFSDFNITTIDKFILKIVRSFSFDLQLPYNFEVELDGKSLHTKAINNLLAETGKDKQLTAFLVNYVTDLAENEENWKFQDNLLKISQLSLNESNQDALKKLKEIPLNSFAETRRKIGKQTQNYQDFISSKLHKGRTILQENNIQPEDLSGKSKKSIWAYFNKPLKKDWFEKEATATNWKHIETGEWTPKTSKIDIPANVKQSITDIFNEIEQKKQSELKAYKLNKDIYKHLFQLGLINEIEKYVHQIREEHNFIHISEFNKKVAEIVTEQPIPFVYERIGEKFKNYLIDEFQDTSVLQWQNLLPLIDNSLANGEKNLIVGDAKQAIYRWRGGDVDQFAHLPESTHFKDVPIIEERMLSLKRNYQEEVLSHNYRSSKEIIKFNNLFFECLLEQLPPFFESYYKGFKQEVGGDKTGGHAQIKFLENEGLEDETLNEIEKQIDDCLERGWRLQDIAILSRRNKDLTLVAEYLTKKDIPVFSSESLNLSQSSEVNLLISSFKLLNDHNNIEAAISICNALSPKHDINLFHVFADKYNFFRALKEELKSKIGFTFPKISGLSLYEIFEELIQQYGISKNDPFVLTFLDFTLKHSSQTNFYEFIEIWESSKDKLNISSPEDLDAVTLMTVHKSKGLEFPVTILPFANQSKGNQASWLWLNTENQENKLPISLVQNYTYLEDTDFSEDSKNENLRNLLDDLNVLYVALTRPKFESYIICEQLKKEPTEIKGLHHFFHPVLDKLENPTTNVYTYGTKSHFKNEAIPKSPADLERIKNSNWKSKIKMSFSAPNIWDVPLTSEESFFRSNPRKFGNLIHLIFSKTDKLNAIENVVNDEYLKGSIDGPDIPEVTMIITQTLELDPLKEIWDKGEHIIEKEIITPDGSSYRPDRLIKFGNQTYLIDFKTGEQKEADEKQIKYYQKLLIALDIKNVKCLLVYCNSLKVIEL